MKAPQFWNQPDSIFARFLSPFGHIYAWSVARRFKRARPYQASIPVICVGNLTAGGTGKTPVCLALGNILKQQHIPFYFLNHGYKSNKKGILVDRSSMTALDVGDEAMLLAKLAPTVVDNHRDRGAQIIERKKTKAIIMDDGFQNPKLIKTLSLIVVDGKTGFGNGRLLPAGPLREPVGRGLKRADAVVIAGPDDKDVSSLIHKLAPDLPILYGHFEPDKKTIEKLRGKPVAAFAGIGRPDKFFDMLTGLGIPVARKTSFPDHYCYTRFDIEQLLYDSNHMPLVTTSKDFIKIPRDIRSQITVVDGQFIFDKPNEIQQLLMGILPQ